MDGEPENQRDARPSFSETNENKDWHIYQDFAITLIKETMTFYKDEKPRIGLEDMVYTYAAINFPKCGNI